MQPIKSTTAIIILAAGRSARLGKPKQLLCYKGKNLLIHAVDEALATGCQNVFVILGSDSELFKKELLLKPVQIIENKEWQEGIASSIRCGLENIKEQLPLTENVLLMVCDQPYVNSALLLNLIEKKQDSGMPIVASFYENTKGTPALFDKKFFQSLIELKGDKGARKIIEDNPDRTTSVQFSEGKTDIDTEEDYELLKKQNDLIG